MPAPIVLKPRWIWTGTELLTGCCLELREGRIGAIVPADAHPAVPEATQRLVLPGFVDAHSHAFQRAFRGHVQWRPADRDDFWSWRDRMYATANGLDPDGVQAVSALTFLEMAEAGVTTVGEFHYLHHAPDGTRYEDPDELARRVLAAAEQVGIRIVLLRVAYARAGAGLPPRDDQRRFYDRRPDDVLAALERLGKGARVGLAAHSVRALDEDWLRALSAWEGVVHAHVSEQPAENEACVREHGVGPLRALEQAGLVSERFTAVHLTHPLPGDVDLLVERGGAIAVCPSTELDLGDGFLPVDARTRARLCVGSDSHAAIDPLGEARTLELHGRALAGRRNVLAPPGERHGLAERLLRACTLEGDRALGGAGRGIVPGEPADLVVLDLDRPAADGVPPLEAAVFGGGPSWVDEVWVGGRCLVAGGRHLRRAQLRRAAAPFLG
ncbi:MAG: formimidoylglutamate deiminase [Myxococcales bacterium]|nr:formimidoylglutamate deiminase [Myxococcales bacterium]